jgi:putative ABC transport system permease protein
MLEAFNINLTSLSLLALIVGLFLVYNTMTFSVVQRKVQIGTLRSIGVTASELTRFILFEAVIIVSAGTVLGFIFSYFISKFLIVFISQTINDLYFVISVREISISPLIILKGISLGVLATILSALKPAREGAAVHPRNVMIRSEQESSLLGKVPLMNTAGVLSIILGTALLLLPSKNIWLSYLGILPVIVGFAMLTPLMIIIIEKLFSPVLKYFFGITGKFSSRSIIQNISRTYIAIAALGLAVAATVGVGTMITSFRSTVVHWLEARLNADLFITAPNLISRKNDVVLPEELLFKIKSLDNVDGVSYYREIEFIQDEKKIRLIATGLSSKAHSGFEFKEGSPEEAWEKFKRGDLLLSEPFAYKSDLKVGDTLELNTDYGTKRFNVCGIYYDYASDEGVVTIHFDHFKKHWNVEGVSGISAFVKEGVPLENVRQEILKLDHGGQELLVRTFRFIRDSSIEIFDRTFLIAKVLQALSVIVAFIGILSSLMSLQLERKRELGILRANGLTPGQVFRIVNLQTLLMGLTAGMLSIPLGKILAAILVFIINKRSFGWTMQFDIIPSIMLEALVISVGAALLAGLYPGYIMSKSSPALALREE